MNLPSRSTELFPSSRTKRRAQLFQTTSTHPKGRDEHILDDGVPGDRANSIPSELEEAQSHQHEQHSEESELLDAELRIEDVRVEFYVDIERVVLGGRWWLGVGERKGDRLALGACEE